LAQDQLKLQAANQALDYKIQQDRQKALDAKAYYDKSKEAAEAEAELKDSILYSDSVDKARKAFLKGGMEAVWGLPTPQFSDTNISTRYQSVLEYFDKSSFGTDAQDYRDLRKTAEEFGIDPNQSRFVLKALVDGRLNRYSAPPTEIYKMINEHSALLESGDTENAKLLGGYIMGLANKSGRRTEIGPDGRIIIAEGGDPTKPLTTRVSGELQNQAIIAEQLFDRINTLRESVNIETVGVRGVWNNLSNIVGGALASVNGTEFKGFKEDVAVTKQRMAQLKSDIMGYIRSDSGNMSDRDSKMLEAAVPEISITESIDTVRTKIDELSDLFLLKEFVARKELGTLQNMLEDRGAKAFSKAIQLGVRKGMTEGRKINLINKAVSSYGEDAGSVMSTLTILVRDGVINTDQALDIGKAVGAIGTGTQG